MSEQHSRRKRIPRAVFVGCQFCGETDKTLRNYGTGKICPVCLKKKQAVSNLDTRKE